MMKTNPYRRKNRLSLAITLALSMSPCLGAGGNFPPSRELAELNGGSGLIINGVDAGDLSGFAVSGAGDVNGDGFDDLIIGAHEADPNDVDKAGTSYVVFGSDQVLPNPFQLSGLDGTNGFAVEGSNDTDFSGRSVSAAGDLNGDGFDDLIIGAPLADPTGLQVAGASYVIFGTDQPFATPLAVSSLDGGNGLIIHGGIFRGRSGRSVAGAGDINGDGFDDLVIGAYTASPNGLYSGASHVVFGSDQGFPNPLDLASIDSTNGFLINGVTLGSRFGKVVSAAGDVNGDGFDDLIISAYRTATGDAYVVFGSDQAFPSPFDLTTLDGSNGLLINGAVGQDGVGQAVGAAGDFNADGIDDLLVGATGVDSHGSNTGAAYVVFGSDIGFVSPLNVDTLDGSNGLVINGVAGVDRAGGAVSGVGDVNADGIDDVLIGADGVDTNGTNSGAGYVVFGSDQALTSPLELASLDGSNGYVLNGASLSDGAGLAVGKAGDFNGDGVADMVIGANDADPNGDDSGATYLVFGGRPENIFTDGFEP